MVFFAQNFVSSLLGRLGIVVYLPSLCGVPPRSERKILLPSELSSMASVSSEKY